MRNLKGWRLIAGLTQEQLAEMAGVHVVTVRNHEQSIATDVSMETAMKLAVVIGQKLGFYIPAEFLCMELDWSVLANAQRRIQAAKKRRKKKPFKQPRVVG